MAALIVNDMIESKASLLEAVFRALGDAIQRRMLRDLALGDGTVDQLTAPAAMSLAAALTHVQALEWAGLIRREVQGRTQWCRLAPGPL